jgi:hypothetical protein
MKKYTGITLFPVALLFVAFLLNCNKSQESLKNNPANNSQRVALDRHAYNFIPDPPGTNKRTISPEQPLTKIRNGGRVTVSNDLRTVGCGGFLDGSWGTNGFHQYVKDTIRLDSIPAADTIRISVNSYDVPNRFTVYDASGTIVAGTSWMGHVSYSGPWGMSINTVETGTLYFKRGTSAYFLFLVETSVNGTSDSYTVSITCN